MPAEVLRFVSEQVGLGSEDGAEAWLRYDWGGRAIKYHRAQIREFFGFREATVSNGEEIAEWLAGHILPHEQDVERVREAFSGKCRRMKVEPPGASRVERLVSSASRRFENRLCATVFARLPQGE